VHTPDAVCLLTKTSSIMIPCPAQLDMTNITNKILPGAVGTTHQNKIYLPQHQNRDAYVAVSLPKWTQKGRPKLTLMCV
jgi:hypothetical protein